MQRRAARTPLTYVGCAFIAYGLLCDWTVYRFPDTKWTSTLACLFGGGILFVSALSAEFRRPKPHSAPPPSPLDLHGDGPSASETLS